MVACRKRKISSIKCCNMKVIIRVGINPCYKPWEIGGIIKNMKGMQAGMYECVRARTCVCGLKLAQSVPWPALQCVLEMEQTSEREHCRMECMSEKRFEVEKQRDGGSFFSIHKQHKHQCLYKGTTQCWRVAEGINQTLLPLPSGNWSISWMSFSARPPAHL